MKIGKAGFYFGIEIALSAAGLTSASSLGGLDRPLRPASLDTNHFV